MVCFTTPPEVVAQWVKDHQFSGTAYPIICFALKLTLVQIKQTIGLTEKK